MVAGLPQGLADILADADASAANGSLFTDSSDLQRLIGHDTLSLKDFVASVLG
ncbi:MAG: hypothetical protein ABJL55_02675 [Roseibium sp.]